MKRRLFLFGAATALAAPAVMRAEGLMRIAVLRESVAPMIQYVEPSQAMQELFLAFEQARRYWLAEHAKTVAYLQS